MTCLLEAAHADVITGFKKAGEKMRMIVGLLPLATSGGPLSSASSDVYKP